jgi:hypothetical protein
LNPTPRTKHGQTCQPQKDPPGDGAARVRLIEATAADLPKLLAVLQCACGDVRAHLKFAIVPTPTRRSVVDVCHLWYTKASDASMKRLVAIDPDGKHAVLYSKKRKFS